MRRDAPNPRMDFDSLKKGDVISQERIEKIYNHRHKADPEGYRLKLLDLRDQVLTYREDLYPKCEGLTIRIMTDPEAREHRWDQTRQTVGRIHRLSDFGARIDSSEFSDAEKKVLATQDNFLGMSSMVLKRDLLKSQKDARLLRAKNETSEDEPEED